MTLADYRWVTIEPLDPANTPIDPITRQPDGRPAYKTAIEIPGEWQEEARSQPGDPTYAYQGDRSFSAVISLNRFDCLAASYTPVIGDKITQKRSRDDEIEEVNLYVTAIENEHSYIADRKYELALSQEEPTRYIP